MEADHWTDTVGYFRNQASGVEADYWTGTVGYFHDLATGVEADHWMDTVGYFHNQAAGVEADHWTVMFGYFHDQTALYVVYFSRNLDVAQSWCSHVGAQASNKMVIMQRTVSLCT
jgi:hypothetical protein